jgi:hypothetical protein
VLGSLAESVSDSLARGFGSDIAAKIARAQSSLAQHVLDRLDDGRGRFAFT